MILKVKQLLFIKKTFFVTVYFNTFKKIFGMQHYTLIEINN